MLRLERAIYLALTMLAVIVCWRSFVFVFRWLPVVYCGDATQTFFDWYSLIVTGPAVPFVGSFLALLLARRNILAIVRRIVAASSAAAAGVVARIFGEMMTPGAWGDCFCCSGAQPSGPRDIRPPVILQFSPVARSWTALAILAVMSLGTLALVIAELRVVEKRNRNVALVTASFLIFFCAGWLIMRAPYFTRWDAEWRYAVILNAIAATACLAGTVAMAKRSIGSLVAAFLLIVLSYVAIYHAVGFFTLVAV